MNPLQQLKRFTKRDVMRSTPTDLRRGCQELGSYYAWLACVLEPNPKSKSSRKRTPSISPRAKRVCQTPLQSGFVTGEGLGFSSPIKVSDEIHSSPSSFAPSDNATRDRSDFEDRVKSEDVSRALAIESLAIICDLARDPASDSIPRRLEFTPESHTYKIPPLNATCIDDGSFVFERMQKGVWQREDLNAYCCLEAKRI